MVAGKYMILVGSTSLPTSSSQTRLHGQRNTHMVYTNLHMVLRLSGFAHCYDRWLFGRQHFLRYGGNVDGAGRAGQGLGSTRQVGAINAVPWLHDNYTHITKCLNLMKIPRTCRILLTWRVKSKHLFTNCHGSLGVTMHAKYWEKRFRQCHAIIIGPCPLQLTWLLMTSLTGWVCMCVLTVICICLKYDSCLLRTLPLVTRIVLLPPILVLHHSHRALSGGLYSVHPPRRGAHTKLLIYRPR